MLKTDTLFVVYVITLHMVCEVEKDAGSISSDWLQGCGCWVRAALVLIPPLCPVLRDRICSYELSLKKDVTDSVSSP